MAQLLAALAVISRIVAIVHLVLFLLFVGKVVFVVHEFNAKLDLFHKALTKPFHSAPLNPDKPDRRRNRRSRIDAGNDTRVKASSSPVDAFEGDTDSEPNEADGSLAPLPPVTSR